MSAACSLTVTGIFDVLRTRTAPPSARPGAVFSNSLPPVWSAVNANDVPLAAGGVAADGGAAAPAASASAASTTTARSRGFVWDIFVRGRGVMSLLDERGGGVRQR